MEGKNLHFLYILNPLKRKPTLWVQRKKKNLEIYWSRMRKLYTVKKTKRKKTWKNSSKDTSIFFTVCLHEIDSILNQFFAP